MPHNRSGAGYEGRVALAARARESEGIPEGGAVPAAPSVPDILALLRQGNLSAESLIQLIALLSGMGVGGLQAPNAEGGSPIEAAMLGGGGGSPF